MDTMIYGLIGIGIGVVVVIIFNAFAWRRFNRRHGGRWAP